MIFIDTSFLIALEFESDEMHNTAKRIFAEVVSKKYGEAFISDYVFDETITFAFAVNRDLARATRLGESLKSSFKILPIKERTFNDAWSIFKNQRQEGLSFTDCTNISVMNEYGVRNIAVFDSDFKSIDGINVLQNS